MSTSIRMKLGPKGFRTKRRPIKNKLPKMKEMQTKQSIQNSLDAAFGVELVWAPPYGSIRY